MKAKKVEIPVDSVTISTAGAAEGQAASAETDLGHADESRLQELEAALRDAENRFLRAVADFDNYRKRSAVTAQELAAEEKRKLMLELLPVLDNFGLAVTHAGDPANDNDFQQGVTHIYRLLTTALEKNGLEMIPSLLHPFDPRWHEAVDMIIDPSVGDMTVTRVYQEGYRMGGKLLRPARVQVSRPEE